MEDDGNWRITRNSNGVFVCGSGGYVARVMRIEGRTEANARLVAAWNRLRMTAMAPLAMLDEIAAAAERAVAKATGERDV